MSKLYEKIDKCPISDLCGTKSLFKDEDGNIVRFDYHDSTFVPHTCQGRSVDSVKPTEVFLGEWFNTRTKKIRWVGPVRTANSAKKPPADNNYKNRGGSPYWQFVQLHVSKLDWLPVEEPEDDQTGQG